MIDCLNCSHPEPPAVLSCFTLPFHHVKVPIRHIYQEGVDLSLSFDLGKSCLEMNGDVALIVVSSVTSETNVRLALERRLC